MNGVRPGQAVALPLFESLESRQLLSAVGQALVSPRATRLRPRFSVLSNLNASAAPGSQLETKIAINPRNSSNIVVVSMDSSQNSDGILVMSSFDGGSTWQRLQLGARQDHLRSGAGRLDPHVAFDNFGNCYIAYIAGVASNQVDLVVARSSNGGNSFSARAIGSPGFVADSPSISAGTYALNRRRQAIWVSYTNEQTGQIDAIRATSSGLGRFGSFTHAMQVSDHAGSYSTVDIGPKGQVVVSWQSPENGFAPAQIFTSADRRGTYNGFSTDRFATWTNVGSESTPAAQPNRGVDAEAALAFARGGPASGRLYMVYTDAPSANSPQTQIMMRYSDNLGASWGPATAVSHSAGAAFLPAMAVDPSTGHIGVTWYDSRNGGGGGATLLYGAVSTDTGNSFSANQQISFGASSWDGASGALSGFDYGDYTGVAFRNGKLMPAWADNSNSTGDNPSGLFDIYTAVVNA